MGGGAASVERFNEKHLKWPAEIHGDELKPLAATVWLATRIVW